MKQQLLISSFVFIGGGIGALFRFLASLSFSQLKLASWQATLLVNALGTLFYFLSLKINNSHNDFSQYFLRFGLFGALTTFSTLSFEVANAFKQGQMLEGILIFSLNIFTGILIAVGIFR